MIKLETNRLLIRDHVEDDLDELFKLLSNRKVMYFLQDLYTSDIAGAKENLKLAIDEAHLERREKYFFALLLKETGQYVGEIGFTLLGGGEAELGYFILEAFWGRGYVTEAATEVLRFAFDDVGLEKIITGCNAENFGSEAVMKKLGMVKTQHLVNHSEIDGKVFDRVCYEIINKG